MKTDWLLDVCRRFYVGVVLVLAGGELLLVLVSWVMSAMTAQEVHSLLSAEGARWFLGRFAEMLASTALVNILLIAMAGGCLWKSGLLEALSVRSLSNYRKRVALFASLLFVVAYALAVLALTVVPHAVLLSSTGHLLSSPFTRALIPIVAFGLLATSVVYGWVSGRFDSLAKAVGSLSYGIGKGAPVVVLYVLVMQFVESLRFVLS